jgi:hypothetical protein
MASNTPRRTVGLLWFGVRGTALLFATLFIFGVIHHHERLGYLLLVAFFATEIVQDVVPRLRR